MRFLDAFFSASDACFYQCPPVSCIKIIASTARISRCRRSPRTTIRRHRPVSGVSDKRSQIAKRRLRRLALLTPRGPTFGTFVAHFGVPKRTLGGLFLVFGLIFSIFGPCLYTLKMIEKNACPKTCPKTSKVGPLIAKMSILASILESFWHHLFIRFLISS